MKKNSVNKTLLLVAASFLTGIAVSAFFIGYNNTDISHDNVLLTTERETKKEKLEAETIEPILSVHKTQTQLSETKQEKSAGSAAEPKIVKTYEELVEEEHKLYSQRFNYYDSIRNNERSDSNWEAQIVDTLEIGNGVVKFADGVEYDSINCAETLCRLDFSYFSNSSDAQGAISTISMKLADSVGAMSLYNNIKDRKIVAYFARPSSPFPNFASN